MSQARSEAITSTMVSIGLILLLIVLSPILLIVFVIGFIGKTIADWGFKRFLKRSDGLKYFCYTTKRSSEAFVVENILPNLPADVIVLRLSSKGYDLENIEQFPGHIAAEMKAQGKGFPYVGKIIDGKLECRSVNHELYRTIVTKRDSSHVVEKVLRFLN